MTRNNEPREIVRYLEDGDPERGFLCMVSHHEAGGPCERPAKMAVYGLAFCEEHAAGTFEELHQDAYEFFARFEHPHVAPLGNPLVRRALRDWRRAIPGPELDHEERTEPLLLAAFPFREELVCEESAAQVADPIPENGHPADYWRDDRQDVHALMRAAYERGMTWLVERLEHERESIAAQLSYAIALSRGEHPEVLKRAPGEHRECPQRGGAPREVAP